MKQTLKQAMYLAETGKSRGLRRAALALDGLPDGGWPETQQAYGYIREELPFRHDRAYTLDEFIEAAYELIEHHNAASVYRARLAS